jgi:putative oxidoreductase
MTFTTTWNDRAKGASFVPVRLALGSAMVYHGSSSLLGARSGQRFERLGIEPGKPWARATGIAEALAGVAAILGVLTRPAALAVLVTQAVAVARVHAKKGHDVMQGGMEHNLALMAIAAGLLVADPRVSAHELLERIVEGRGGRRRRGRARRTMLSRAGRLVR